MATVAREVLYDASRLWTRVLNPTPNGIDRVDALLARGLFQEVQRKDRPVSALVFGLRGPCLLPASEGLAALERAERIWSDELSLRTEGFIAEIEAWIEGRRNASLRSQRLVQHRSQRIRAALIALWRRAMRASQDPVRFASPDAIYLNATHFPLDWPGHVAWLQKRQDVRLVGFVHDLLPIESPEWFWQGESHKHRMRISLLARRGAGAIVTTSAVEQRLHEEMAHAGRRDFQIMRAHPPAPPLFRTKARHNQRLRASSYFIVCGTIEPRKNHMLLLRVWRRLVSQMGTNAPKLIVIGKRGWLCDEIIRAMHDPALSGHVLELSGLTSANYKALLDNARALLAPSFAEGFGFPVAEALMSGTPVIASSIPAFREQTTDLTALIDPHADDLWAEAIVYRSSLPRDLRPPPREVSSNESEADYLQTINDFLQTL